MVKCYYRILNVSNTATYRQIRNAYKRIYSELKKNSVQNNEVRDYLKDVVEAWNCLKNLKKRRAYDARMQFETHFGHSRWQPKVSSSYLGRTIENVSQEPELLNQNSVASVVADATEKAPLQPTIVKSQSSDNLAPDRPKRRKRNSLFKINLFRSKKKVQSEQNELRIIEATTSQTAPAQRKNNRKSIKKIFKQLFKRK